MRQADVTRRGLAVALAFTVMTANSAPVAVAQEHLACRAGQERFLYGFRALKAELGRVMGEPLGCERFNPGTGETQQATTTGLAVYDKRRNVPVFTQADGLIYWRGSGLIPPRLAERRFAAFQGVWEFDEFTLSVRYDGRATATWSALQRCSPHTLGPCDTMQGLSFVRGGRAEIVLTAIDGSTAFGRIFYRVDEEGGRSWVPLREGPISLHFGPNGRAELRQAHATMVLCKPRLRAETPRDQFPCNRQ